MKNRLRELQLALSHPPGPHLDDEALAALATAEAAGEDVAQAYTEQLRHIENCVPCAEAYEQLVGTMITAVHEMMQAAANISPTAVYTQLLAHRLPTLSQKLQTIVAGLPLWFTQPPENERDLAPITQRTALSPAESRAIIQTIGRSLTSLKLFLQGMADNSWGIALNVTTDLSDAGRWLQLQAAPQPTVATLSSQQTGNKWLVLERPFPPDWLLTVRAYRLSPLACRLTVRADRPVLAQEQGRKVQTANGSQIETAVTDENGVATFAPVPIAALTQLEIILVSDSENNSVAE